MKRLYLAHFVNKKTSFENSLNNKESKIPVESKTSYSVAILKTEELHSHKGQIEIQYNLLLTLVFLQPAGPSTIPTKAVHGFPNPAEYLPGNSTKCSKK